MVEKYIEQFLLYYHYCPLPGVGLLRIAAESAVIDLAEKKINAPVQKIIFSKDELPADDLVTYISTQSNQTHEESGYFLQEVCQQISEISTLQSFRIGNIGQFSKDEFNTIFFQQDESSLVMTPSLNLHRVIHPDSSHKVLVGDVELTNVIINKRAEKSINAIKLTWGVWAACLFMITTVFIVIYLSEEKSSNTYGNIILVTPQETTATYQEFIP